MAGSTARAATSPTSGTERNTATEARSSIGTTTRVDGASLDHGTAKAAAVATPTRATPANTAGWVSRVGENAVSTASRATTGTQKAVCGSRGAVFAARSRERLGTDASARNVHPHM
jgi:hypothetical protein